VIFFKGFLFSRFKIWKRKAGVRKFVVHSTREEEDGVSRHTLHLREEKDNIQYPTLIPLRGQATRHSSKEKRIGVGNRGEVPGWRLILMLEFYAGFIQDLEGGGMHDRGIEHIPLIFGFDFNG
jgi:hypothetical protein